MNRHTPIPPVSSKRSLVSLAAGRLLRQMRKILIALEHRRQVRHLSELDDRTLKDIGLSRAVVDGALAEPLTRDPSLMLVRSVERKAQVQGRSPEPRRERPLVKSANARCA
jgi:uncharacterized protein YjiS (DUF1127 family)